MCSVRTLQFEFIKHAYNVSRTGPYRCQFPHGMKLSFISIVLSFGKRRSWRQHKPRLCKQFSSLSLEVQSEIAICTTCYLSQPKLLNNLPTLICAGSCISHYPRNLLALQSVAAFSITVKRLSIDGTDIRELIDLRPRRNGGDGFRSNRQPWDAPWGDSAFWDRPRDCTARTRNHILHGCPWVEQTFLTRQASSNHAFPECAELMNWRNGIYVLDMLYLVFN